MKIFPLVLLLVVLTLYVSGCAVSNKYGPYMGQVVEKESGAPIDGAVVFMEFYTDGLFGISQYEDAVEVLTDAKGEFSIPAKRIFSRWPAPFSNWDPGYAIIFKPGYGAFPRHKGTLVDDERNILPEKRHVTIKLPKLKTRNERVDNLSNLYAGSAPSSAYPNLRKLEKIERKETGIDP